MTTSACTGQLAPRAMRTSATVALAVLLLAFAGSAGARELQVSQGQIVQSLCNALLRSGSGQGLSICKLTRSVLASPLLDSTLHL